MKKYEVEISPYPENFRELNKDAQIFLMEKRQREVTKQILEHPDLWEWITVQELDKKIVGEIKSRQTIFLCAAGGLWVENSSPAAYNLMVNSKSGAGKDYVTKNTLKILPRSRVESRTRISPAAFTYWHNSKFEPEWTWDGKVCYLSDVSNAILNHDVFKVMCTEGSYATVVKDQKAVDILVKGKPAIFITSAGAMPNEEILRRFPIIDLDETQEQTKAIMERAALYAMNGISVSYEPKILAALNELQRVKVCVPFANKFVQAFTDKHVIMRTHFPRLIDYIKASAALYQRQRKKNENGEILAEPSDYDRARIVLEKTTSNPLMIPLTKNDKRLIALARSIGEPFTIPDILHKVNFMSGHTLYAYMGKLSEKGFFTVSKQEKEKGRPVGVYSFVDFEFSIPTWEEICNISTKSSDATITTITSESSENKKEASTIEKKRLSNKKTVVSSDSARGLSELSELFEVKNKPSPIENKDFFGERLKQLKFLRDHGKFIGHGGSVFGPFKEGEIKPIPELLAGILIKKEIATEIVA